MVDIQYMIGSDTLGTDNTDDDNQRFVSAVKSALGTEYPDFDINVELGESSTVEVNVAGLTALDAIIIGDIVYGISNDVWGKANY